MAKYILVAFDKDAEADKFVENLQAGLVFQAKDVVDGVPTGYQMLSDTSMFVRGVFQRPTMFHDPKTCKPGPKAGWTRGSKRGWMLCTECGKPPEGWARGDGWFTALGTNQLPVSPQAPEYRGFGKPGHYFDPDLKDFVPYEQPPKRPFEIIRGPDGTPAEIVQLLAPALTMEEAKNVAP